jgi:hypothetical protein
MREPGFPCPLCGAARSCHHGDVPEVIIPAKVEETVDRRKLNLGRRVKIAGGGNYSGRGRPRK